MSVLERAMLAVQAFTSNELAFLSMLFFGVGLYGNLQCLVMPGPT